MRASTFTHDFLLLMAGPVVWAAHFVAIYGFTGLVCARRVPVVEGAAGWIVVAMGVLAAAVLFAWLRARPATEDPATGRFVRWSSRALAALALLAIAWETLAVFLIPGCVPPR